MEKVKILAVAPYEGIADIIREAAAERGDIDITVQTGDLYHGKKRIDNCENAEYYLKNGKQKNNFTKKCFKIKRHTEEKL